MSPAARPFGPTISRRTVLAGGAATLLLAACGSDSGSKGEGTSTTTEDTAGGGSLIALFPQSGFVVAEMPQRITFGLADEGGAMLAEGPANLDFEVRRDGDKVMDLSSAFHNEGIPRGYYPLEATFPATGDYTVVARVDGHDVDASFSVGAESSVPQVGDVMPVFDTPTTKDARGVDPICTADPQCPLHADDLRATLAADKPTALLVGTPAYCQVGICGPVLDVLLAVRPSAPDITCIHAEVYTSGAAAAEDIQSAKLTEAVEQLGLTYEPALFVIGSDGKLAARLDNIYDQAELKRTLEQAA
jgi:hypothetical protein